MSETTEIKDPCKHEKAFMLPRFVRRKPEFKKTNTTHYCPDCKTYLKIVRRDDVSSQNS